MDKASTVIIGAGVVGCALARTLAPSRSVVVLEKLDQPGQVTSKTNSGVIHSGIHLPPEFLKAQLARRGKQLVEAYCHERAVPYSKVGMHILVAKADFLGLWPELGRLINMLRRAKAQGIPVHWVDGRAVRKREPCVECLFGLFIPEVGIIDQTKFVASLEQDARQAGAQFAYRQSVQQIVRDGNRWRVCTENGAYEADLVINAAGLDAADVARRAGFEYKQVYYRGEYYEVNRETSKLELNGLVYPVHRPGKPGLGVHLTATVTGRILIGPNARAVPGPEWAERDKTPAEEFHKEAVQFMPDLKLEHISWAYAGIRPKLTSEPGEQDFMVRVEPGKSFVNLIGIESPGLTASLALAEHVHRELGKVA